MQVANLVYAGTKSSQCFSDHFLVQAEKDIGDLHQPAVPRGEAVVARAVRVPAGDHDRRGRLRAARRRAAEPAQVRRAAAASCWRRPGARRPSGTARFRREMAKVFPEHPLAPLGMDHPVFHTVYDITELKARHGKPRPLEGITLGGRLGVIYSQDGLNDTAHTQGCCCCGGNEITNCGQVNVNILAYALLY